MACPVTCGGDFDLDARDVALVRAAKHGAPEAFATLVENYKGFVYRTAFGVVHNRSDAEDIVQDVFIKVYQSLRKLRQEETFPSWLARITVRSALDLLQRHKSRPTVPLETDVQSLAETMGHAQLRMELDEAMAKLSDEHRVILTLREIHGFRYEELADILQIPVGTVRSRLHIARRFLRDVLDSS